MLKLHPGVIQLIRLTPMQISSKHATECTYQSLCGCCDVGNSTSAVKLVMILDVLIGKRMIVHA